FGAMRRWLDTRDPSRPVLYERDPSFKDSDFYSLMYPSLELLELIGRREEPRSGTLSMHGMVFDADADADGAPDPVDERRRGLPFLLVEYAHAMGNGPGSLSDYWRIMRDYDRICGGFVWEWIDHGFAATTADGIPYIMHGQDVDYEPNGGRFSLHGLVFADRTPTPALAQLAKAYEPLRIEVAGDAITIRNDRHSADTSDLEFIWTLQGGAATPGEGLLEIAPLSAGSSVIVPLPAAVARSAGNAARVFTVQARLRAVTTWAPAGHIVAWGEAERAPAQVPTPVIAQGAGGRVDSGEVHLGDAVFDGATGRLLSLAGMEVDGPWLDLHRAPTENDHGQGDNNNIAKVWQQTGMNRMEHRTDAVRSGDGWLETTGRTAARTHPHGVAWTMLWQQDGDGLELTVTADFVGPWADTPYMHRDIWVPRLGLLFALPGAYADVAWQGRGPGETYVDSWEGSPLGRYVESIDGLQVHYPVPQENGNHIDTSLLTVRGDGVPELRVEGREVFDFTARRWTSHDLERAAHPHELVDSGRVWLNIDHRQLGLGSASVGPATPERYRISRETTTWRVRISAG
ncbi:glycoside hydrolase family 2 TIM barrel-domain containing protein, partial [Microbacterium sp.]|uniref:glycoside hydrolase family 2 TIM barrel-domain containing protein n=1 Tax=Microbacterium sp. TaxID=51671 RepID=UPI0027373AF2